MKKITKIACIFFACVALGQSITVSNVFAKEPVVEQKSEEALSEQVTANVYESCDIGEDIGLNKTWNIKFNQPMEKKSFEGNIKVINKSTGQPIEITISQGESLRNVIVTAKYEADTVYSLIVDKNVRSQIGDNLKEPVTATFKTIGKIKHIESIQSSINQNDEFKLPAKVKATMTDGKTKLVDIVWDKQFEGASKAGKYTYTGTVEGYNEKVILNLTVKEVESSSEKQKSHSLVQEKTVEYLSNPDNRESVMSRAIELHDGDASNTCVYFASEALRRGGLADLPNQTCNTVGLTRELENRGWIKSTDLSQLLPGDICFTISYGYGPTHAYTFMKWVDPKSYKYAYICDNQGNEYGNSYHQRSINFATSTKDPISYFMYRP